MQISGHGAHPGTETTFTENVSSRGARVLSVRRWKINDRIEVTTLAGSFRTVARVAYCHTVPSAGFAVGLEFVEPSGAWVVGDGFKSLTIRDCLAFLRVFFEDFVYCTNPTLGSESGPGTSGRAPNCAS